LIYLAKVALPGAYASASITLRVIGARKPFQNQAIFLKKELYFNCYHMFTCLILKDFVLIKDLTESPYENLNTETETGTTIPLSHYSTRFSH
jgi:hypothetical protein